MLSLLRFVFPFTLALLILPQNLLAEEAGAKGESAETKGGEAPEPFDAEHIFGFVDGSDIGEKGEQEIESVTVGRFGRIGGYNNAANETSYRNTMTDNIRLSFGTLTDYYNIHNVAGYGNISAATFSGLTAEFRVNVLNRATSPFGMSISFNPEWRQFDPDSGARAQNYALPVTLLLDKELIEQKLFIAASASYAPSFLRVNDSYEHDDSVTVTSSASYQVVQNIFAAAEIRHENMAVNGDVIAHALYVGPSLYYKVLPNLSVKVAWAAQIPDVGAKSLDLTAYDRNQFELHLAFSF
ncbi:MAG: hypothetical protein P4L76_18440 [Beijerinckiaceae bacterium]|nr:hypothetical protein [Beijerinckiaceae bacterium]